jgi:hypothetical protein
LVVVTVGGECRPVCWRPSVWGFFTDAGVGCVAAGCRC